MQGHLAVASRRNFISPSLGFSIGAHAGLSAGAAFFVIFILLAFSLLKADLSVRSWQTALLIWLILPLLGGLFGGLSGQWAARDRLTPWSKRAVPIAPKYFGPGSQHSFGWYLQRDSAVPVNSIGAMCHWLQGCAYVTDLDQFRAVDYWQHPIEFEQTRTGDCEDHALWAWRKLIELGYPAELMVGTSYRHNLQGEYHAWVVFTRKNRRYLLEAAHKQAALIAPLPEVQHLYDPDFGVDQQLQTYSYAPMRKPARS